MRNFILKSLIIVAVITSIIACSKEGPQGPAGANGTNGTNGNANVMYSDWITYNANFSNVANYKSMQVIVPQYTQGFVDSGGLYIAFARWQNNVHYQLPLLKKFNSTSSPVVQIECTGISFTSTGELRFDCSRLDGNNLQSEFTTLITSSDLEVRYFLIKGTTNLRLANGTTVQDYYKSKSYEEICEITGAKL